MTSRATTPKKKPKRMPIAELRARHEVAHRAIADIRNLLEDADPVGDPVDFAEREKKALALFGEVNALLPLREPLSDAERERLERELEDKPDDETLRKMLVLMEKILDDPSVPEDIKKQIPREDIHEALASLDEVALLEPIARATRALTEDLQKPRTRDPKKAALRRETEKQAAKRRS